MGNMMMMIIIIIIIIKLPDQATSDVCKGGEFICFTCIHAPSSTATFFA
jgi:hypothetical protein